MFIRPELHLDSKFLLLPINKMVFINLLCDTFTSALSCSRIEQPQCEANADNEIVSTTVEHFHEGRCFRQERKKDLINKGAE